MNTDQLRQALKELNGKRDVIFHFARAEECLVANAMLVPDEPDHMVKVTDGHHIFILDAQNVDWIKIG